MTPYPLELFSARSVLQPRIWAILDAALEAFDTVVNRELPSLPGTQTSTIAAMVCDQAYRNITLNLAGDDGLFRASHRGQRFFVFDGLLVLRVKKLNRNFLSSNIRTRQASHWNRQLSLDGVPTLSRLELGYQVDLTGSVLTGVFVLLRLGNDVQWLWQIHGAQVSTFAVQPVLPIPDFGSGIQYLYESDVYQR